LDLNFLNRSLKRGWDKEDHIRQVSGGQPAFEVLLKGEECSCMRVKPKGLLERQPRRGERMIDGSLEPIQGTIRHSIGPEGGSDSMVEDASKRVVASPPRIPQMLVIQCSGPTPPNNKVGLETDIKPEFGEEV